MFLNKSIFKKWLKAAYNGSGLKVGMVYDGLVVSGSSWVSWTKRETIPNWFKAALIELTGELPQEGEMMEFKKGDNPQMVIPNTYHDLPYKFMEAKINLEVTPVVYGSKWNQYRLLQRKDTNEIVTLSEDMYSVIDFSSLEEESIPAGPSSEGRECDVIYWKNEFSALALCAYKMDDPLGLIDLLESINFWRDK